MRVLHTNWTAAVLFTALTCAGAAACGGAARSGPETAPTASGGASTGDLEALYRSRTDSATLRFNAADVHFMTGMIAHHAQALVMARLAPTHGASPPMRTLTSRILNSQQDEIVWMQRWLHDRGQPVPEVRIEGTHMELRGAGEDDMHMPGMLTQDQLRDLDRARGTEFDRRFLTYMIQHHRGAVTMVDELFGTDGAAQGGATFKLASDIQADQTTEIARMQRMLEALPHTERQP